MKPAAWARLSRAGWLAVAVAAAPAAAQDAVLVTRQSNVFGNLVVGAGPVVDSGGFNEFLSTLDTTYAREVADAGAVSGAWSGLPVSGSAGFASAAEYAFGGSLVVAEGSVATEGDTPYGYVSLGVNAISNVRLEFQVPVITNYTLSGSVLAVRGPDVDLRTSQAAASVQFTAPGSTTWHTDSHLGGFVASGTLLPGSTYRLTGNASARLNGDAQYAIHLVLSPVPEPAAWTLLLLGLLALPRHCRLPAREASA